MHMLAKFHDKVRFNTYRVCVKEHSSSETFISIEHQSHARIVAGFLLAVSLSSILDLSKLFGLNFVMLLPLMHPQGCIVFLFRDGGSVPAMCADARPSTGIHPCLVHARTLLCGG